MSLSMVVCLHWLVFVPIHGNCGRIFYAFVRAKLRQQTAGRMAYFYVCVDGTRRVGQSTNQSDINGGFIRSTPEEATR